MCVCQVFYYHVYVPFSAPFHHHYTLTMPFYVNICLYFHTHVYTRTHIHTHTHTVMYSGERVAFLDSFTNLLSAANAMSEGLTYRNDQRKIDTHTHDAVTASVACAGMCVCIYVCMCVYSPALALPPFNPAIHPCN